mmetsp:Transcript_4719/g.15034  ORF Transcript_4719/g.15034 Transcript_4719/m.15034 type:complete len:86 (-) Transcript_4719:2748-3005(-)
MHFLGLKSLDVKSIIFSIRCSRVGKRSMLPYFLLATSCDLYPETPLFAGFHTELTTICMTIPRQSCECPSAQATKLAARGSAHCR